MNPTTTNLIELRDAIASRTLSATQATQAYLSRIEQYNAPLHVYHEVYAERALARAALVDAGQITGPLAGVPIALKDVLCTAYGHTTCSSKMLANFQAPYTATAVARLEAAGAVILGKTIMDEFAMGSSTENSAVGPVRNPWDVTRVPGGSSGGSAAAVAADLCAASLGSDTGGSIRQPAALCGIVGYKPTYGRISRWGLVAFASSLDQIGPFTRTVADAALLTQIMAGHDPLDSTCAPLPAPDLMSTLHQPVKNLRIGIARQYLSDKNHPAVQQAMNEAIRLYQAQGATMVEVDLPHTEYGIPTYYLVATAEASSNLARYDGVRYGHRSPTATNILQVYSKSRAEGFGAEVKRRIMLGTYALSSGYYDAYYLRALKVRRLIKQDFDRAFAGANPSGANASGGGGGCDAILCPTTTDPAFAFGEKADDPLAMYMNDVYTVNANLAGIPGLSFPAGFAQVNGKALPIGLQLLGPAFDDVKLLRIAQMYQAVTKHHEARPGMSF